MTMRNVPLAEARADAANLGRRIREHRLNCSDCRDRQPCEYLRDMREDLRDIRHEIKHWFDPGPDQEGLF